MYEDGTPFDGFIPDSKNSATLARLTNGKTYTFEIHAINATGSGPWSALSNAVVPNEPTAPTAAPFASWPALVARQYLDLTGQPPTSSNSTYWVTALDSGAKQKGELITSIRHGSDSSTNVDPAARLYRAFLGRAPDAGGLKFWVNRRRTGTWTLVRMADYFAASSEFKRKYGSLTNQQFVTRIYTDVLGRNASPPDVDYWTTQLDLKRRTRGSVMVGFSESSEYIRKQAEIIDASVAYAFLLGRVPSSAELNDWVVRQRAGTTPSALATELLNSAKYAIHITG
jgi:hypothetical protein